MSTAAANAIAEKERTAALDVGQLFREHGSFLARSLQRLAGDGPHVDDLLQETFVVAFRRQADFDQLRGSSRAWLYGIASHLASRHGRGRRRFRRFCSRLASQSSASEPARPDQLVEQSEEVTRFHALLDSLPFKQREVLVLREIEGLECSEIAKLLGIPVGTVWTRLHHARKRLVRLAEKQRLREKRARPWQSLLLCEATFGETVSPARLARNAAAIHRQLDGVASTVFSAGKVITALLAVVALSGLAAIELTRAPAFRASASAGARHTVAAPAALTKAKAPPPRDRLTATSASARTAAVPRRERRPESHTEEAKRRTTASKKVRPAPVKPGKKVFLPQPDDKVPAPGSPDSTLSEQLLLFDAANRSLRAGRHSEAMRTIEELLLRFPSTPLRAEAELTRVEALVRAGRTGAALATVQKLTADPSHRGRRGELLRLQGDLHRRSGNCRQALARYREALKHDLTADDRGAARRGERACLAKAGRKGPTGWAQRWHGSRSAAVAAQSDHLATGGRR